MVRDALRTCCVLLPPLAIIFTVGIVVRRATGPWGGPVTGGSGLIATAAMLAAAALLTVPCIIIWRRVLIPRFETRGVVRAVVAILAATTMLLPMMLVAAIFGVGSVNLAFAFAGPIGLGILATGLALRTGDTLHCPECDYQLPPGSDAPSERCPECGSPWTGVLTRGRRVRSPFMIVAGGILAALWLVPMFTSSLSPEAGFYRQMPTAVLLPWIERTASHDARLPLLLTELTGRTLDGAELSRLSHGLLDRRQREGRFPRPAVAAWFEGLIATPGALPQDVVHRFFLEGLEPAAELPQTIARDESVTLRISGRFRFAFQSYWIFARIEEITIDGQALPLSDTADWVFGLYLDSGTGPHAAGASRMKLAQQWIPGTQGTPGQPGVYTVRVVVRLAYLPNGMLPPDHPRDPGTSPAAAPMPPMLFTETVTIERSITITDRP